MTSPAVHQLADDADALVATLSDEQFAWQPAPNAWSIAQCIDHLNVTARLYLPLLDEGSPTPSARAYTVRAVYLLVARADVRPNAGAAARACG
jgi:hypothetical protein